MGRIFEKRKYKMFARFDRMAKTFTRIGKEVAIAVKQGGPDPNTNPRLRAAIANAKAANMPKDRVDAAIKRASSKDEKELQEIIYEGYGPHGIGMIVECATDNPTRTVANIRMYFTKHGGTLGSSGSVAFLFERKGVFKIGKEGVDSDELELEMIDYGAEDFAVDDEDIYIYTSFGDFVKMQKALEEKKINVKSAELQYIPSTQTDVTEKQEEDVIKLVEAIEEDDDVQNVFHAMK
ncbi:MAG TPA: YebC/PmpR family DNA-binding transcriptional regulator [bacterium]|nr:YebC/PmpR family DNA-binding transcriptional regulator [bacterium]HMZ05539.1 YebC/PmpR family DNA-binding transcriptional regulator [bacterium]HNB10466.1 YebC/PmpR family DNA-binding transcriptional regulator [bacterium]HNB57223.1 YebC/PmpR family DNA-binding transcriptional regulator [bacterium]HNC50040.1 YebC/PmpR family DNA-binding transcriptional regulator [bacterium]